MKQKKFYFLSLVILIGLQSFSFANTKYIELNNINLSGLKIGLSTSYFIDRTKKESFETIKNKLKKFKSSKKESLGFGFLDAAVWIHFKIKNSDNKNRELFLELGYPLTDKIEFFIPKKGKYVKRVSGDIFSFDKREYDHENFIFKINAEPGIHSYYIKITSKSSLNIPLSIWSRKALDKKITTERLLMGIYFGILIVMFVYNFFIFIATRDQHYFFYTLFIFAYIFLSLSMNGLGFMFLWPNTIWLNNSTPFMLGITVGIAMLFSQSYFSTWKNSKKINILLIVMAIISFIFAIASWKLPYGLSVRLVSVNNALGAVTLVFIGIYFITQKKREAIYYSLAWIFTIIGTILTTGKNAGFLPNNFITIWSFQFGNVIQIVLFSLGLADKINSMKNELKVLNTDLEGQVHVRTEELESAMEELESTNDTLIQTRDALWGEMELAKKIQTVLLPEKPEITNYEITGYMKPADEVGGDYYDVINVVGMDWIIIGDVSGHGVPAGLIMMMVQTSIHTVLDKNPNMDPSELLEVVNRIISDNIKRLGEDKYMTITVFAGHKDGKFFFSGLHQDIMIYRSQTNKVELVETEGIWIGIMEDINGMVNDSNLELHVEDVMLLYTDGITEATISSSAAKEEMYGEEKLLSMLKRFGNETTDEIQSQILNSLEGFNQQDDVTLLIIKRLY